MAEMIASPGEPAVDVPDVDSVDRAVASLANNFDEEWGWNLLPGERWAGLVYDSLAGTATAAPPDTEK